MAISTAPLSIVPLHPCLGARVEGVDLTRSLPDETFQRIAEAFEEHSVLVFHDQRLTDAQQKAFSERWGPLENTIVSPGQEARYDPKLVDLSNTDPDHGGLMDWSDRRMVYHSGNQLWHTDSSFKPVPAHSSALSGREVPPEGGETEFASMRHAYAELPADVKARLEGKVAVHSIIYSRNLIAKDLFDPAQAAALPAVRHALLRTNPVNGRATFYIGSHAWFIEGLPYTESRRLLDELLALTTAPERVYRHVWKQWDLVMWDNRCVLHRGRPWDSARYPRIMRRTTVAGEGPTANPPLADPASLPALEQA
jgi:alpha-ketoglutarate-dependent 2,4-dichlorophenoxyacetate dioxygenase